MSKNLLWLAGILAVVAFLMMRDRVPTPGPRTVVTATPAVPPQEILIDLRNNAYHADQGLPVEVLEANVKGEMLLKLTLDGSPYSMARIHLTYGDTPRGWTFNLGDSRTNNGHGGDGGTQSRDAEVQIHNQNLGIFGNDFMEGRDHKLRVVKDIIGAEGNEVSIQVSNEDVQYASAATTDGLNSPYLFALAGQQEREGQVNHDLYVAFNRVVSGRGRRGSGLTDVRIELLQP